MSKQESLDRLRELLHPGDELWTSVSHVSPSGMTRWIRVFVMRDNTPVDISWNVARAVGSPHNTRNHQGVERGGCGMDMGFDLVYSLSRALFPDGYNCPAYKNNGTDYIGDAPETGRKCNANDHFNERDKSKVPYHHKDSGYALRQRWL